MNCAGVMPTGHLQRLLSVAMVRLWPSLLRQLQLQQLALRQHLLQLLHQHQRLLPHVPQRLLQLPPPK